MKSSKRLRRLTAALAAALAVTLARAPAAGAAGAGGAFGLDPIWDDGKAEFSTYHGTTERYGKTRATEARIIVVKEDLVRSTLVKSDAGPLPGRTLEALKMNFIADFPTGTSTVCWAPLCSIYVIRGIDVPFWLPGVRPRVAASTLPYFRFARE